jgi:hypothetical protein
VLEAELEQTGRILVRASMKFIDRDRIGFEPDIAMKGTSYEC